MVVVSAFLSARTLRARRTWMNFSNQKDLPETTNWLTVVRTGCQPVQRHCPKISHCTSCRAYQVETYDRNWYGTGCGSDRVIDTGYPLATPSGSVSRNWYGTGCGSDRLSARATRLLPQAVPYPSHPTECFYDCVGMDAVWFGLRDSGFV